MLKIEPSPEDGAECWRCLLKKLMGECFSKKRNLYKIRPPGHGGSVPSGGIAVGQ